MTSIVIHPAAPRVIASVLSSDPGPTRSAFSLLDALSNGEIRVRRCWYVAHDRASLWSMLLLLGEMRGSRGLFAIETASGQIFKGRSAAQLLETKEIEGRIKGSAEARGWVMAPSCEAARDIQTPYVEVNQADWREGLLTRGVLNQRSKQDPLIRCAVEGIFRNRATGILEIPAVEGMSRDARVHVYDAIGVGVVALARYLGQPLTLPRWLLADLMRLAIRLRAEKVGRDAAKKLGAPGASKPGRRWTRGQKANAHAKRAQTRAAKVTGTTR